MEKRDKDISFVAEHYGFEHQLNKFLEEIGELLIEISKYKNASSPEEKDNALIGIEEELADVEFLLRQLKYMCHQDEVEETLDRKIKRQLRRIRAREKTTK